MLVARLLRRLIVRGRITVIDAAGAAHHFGDGSGQKVTVRLHERSLGWRLYFNPGLMFGEAFMDGTLTIEEGDLYGALSILLGNIPGNLPRAAYSPLFGRLEFWFRRLRQMNDLVRSRRNVAHHYDLSSELYDLFLDSDRQYSCAYFEHPNDDLEKAQLNKKRHIATKLLLKPGMRVLDIGCGWGGLALYLAREHGVHVTGLTLSVEQHRLASERAKETRLSHQVEFHLRDYRVETGCYDRIVSVGMFEHVGIDHYQSFVTKLRDLLTDDGVALLHSIGRRDSPGMTSPWLRKYIFPGGYCPALSEVIPVIESADLWLTDVEVLRLHYAETLRHWRARFQRNRQRAAALYDERFCRMWDIYLTGCEVAFRFQTMMVFQMQLARRIDTVPLTRDYMLSEERPQNDAARGRIRTPANMA